MNNFNTLNKKTPELSKAIKKRIEQCFRKEGYLFKEVETRTGYCTCCERRFPFDRKIRHNEEAYCPKCNSPVIIKDAGRGRGNLVDRLYIGAFQNLKDGTLVLRCFLCSRNFGYSYENTDIDLSEHIRIYFKNGARYSFKYGWYGWQSIQKLPAIARYNYSFYPYYEKGMLELQYVNVEAVEKNKFFKHSNFADIAYSKKGIPDAYLHKYIDLFNRYPIITEKLIKAGYVNVVNAIVDDSTAGYLNYRKTDLRGFLRMNNAELKFLRELTTRDARTAIRVKGYKLPLNNETLHYAQHEYANYSEIKKSLGELNPELDVDKIIAYLVKHKKPFSIYRDYLKWLNKHNFEKTKKTLYPRNLMLAHDEMAEYNRRMEQALKKQELEKIQSNFTENQLPYLNEKYTYSDNNFIVRPFQNTAEIVDEGQIQNICVGGDNYTKAYISGKTLLFCLRNKTEPDKPLCTIELNNSGRLIQARMKRNADPPDYVREFIEKWQKFYKTKNVNKREVA